MKKLLVLLWVVCSIFLIWTSFIQSKAKGEDYIDLTEYIEPKNNEEEALGVDYGKTLEYEPAYVLGDVEELHIEATAYCYGTTTASGKKVREGYAAMARGYMGKTAIVYENFDGKPGDLIGIYEIEDTGGDERIKEGRCIDIYIPDYDAYVEFGRQNVIVFIVDAKG